MVKDKFSYLCRLLDIIVTITVLGLAAITAEAGTYSGGAGEPNEPYQINNVADWQELMAASSSERTKFFELTSNIDFNGVDLTPIGSFSGVFNGNGYTVSNARIETPGRYSAGLFHELSYGGYLFNLHNVNCKMTAKYNVGGLVSNNKGTIFGCSSSGVVSGERTVGGLVGYNGAKISNCYSEGTIIGGEYIGGLVGSSSNGLINNCYSTASVSGSSKVGGFAGANSFDNDMKNCYSTGFVQGITDTGGFAGSDKYDTSSIIACFWDIQTSGLSESAGEAVGLTTEQMKNPDNFINAGWDTFGQADDGYRDFWMLSPGQYPHLAQNQSQYIFQGQGTVEDPYQIYTLTDLFAINSNITSNYILMNDLDYAGLLSDDSVVAFFFGKFDGNNKTMRNFTTINSKVGRVGIFGYIENSDITNLNIKDVNIIGYDYIGGLAGWIYKSKIDNCSVSGKIFAIDYTAGGLIGRARNSEIINCKAKINIYAWGHSVGGLIGDNHKSTVNNCHSRSIVSGDYANLGGLIGHNYSSTVTNSSSISTVLGTEEYVDYVGGLVGYNGGGSLIDSCFSDGNTIGIWYVGGLVGCISSSTVQNSYCSGKVNGEREFGGLIGYDSYIGSSTTANSYSICAVGEGEKRGAFLGYTYELIENKYLSSFWNSDICTGLADLGYAYTPNGYNIDLEGVYGLDTASLQMKQTFVDAGWDFDTPIWTIDEGVDYPRLWWEMSVEPVDLVIELSENIDTMSLQKGITNSLHVKLDTALQLLEDENENNDTAAVNLLQAFINTVQAQSGKKIPETDADTLIAAAQEIIALLSDE